MSVSDHGQFPHRLGKVIGILKEDRVGPSAKHPLHDGGPPNTEEHRDPRREEHCAVGLFLEEISDCAHQEEVGAHRRGEEDRKDETALDDNPESRK